MIDGIVAKPRALLREQGNHPRRVEPIYSLRPVLPCESFG